ncbi:MAG: glycosyltransferase family 39 protein, partial [Chloroflexota bacterium]|nr:glycosyltransferase family 39 protein [Chloroflexota bacterium]
MFRVTQSIVEDHSLVVRDEIFHYSEPYSVWGLGQSLVAIPLFLLGKLLRSDTQWFISLTNSFVVAVAAAIVYLTGLSLGYRRGRAIVVALAFGLASLAWPYTRTFFSEPLTGLALITAIFAIRSFRVTGREKYLPLAGFAMGVGLLARVDFGVYLPVLTLYLLWPSSDRGWRSLLNGRLLLILVTFVPLVAVFLGYNYIRYGSLLATGYGWAVDSILHPSMDQNVMAVYGLLLGGKGLLLYQPLALLALFCWPRFARAAPPEACTFALLFLARVAMLSFIPTWEGCVSWGPRQLVSLTPILILPIGFFLPRHARLPNWRSVVFALFLALGFLAQIPGIVFWHADFTNKLIHSQLVTQEQMLFDLPRSPMVVQWRWLLEGQWSDFLVPVSDPALAGLTHLYLLLGAGGAGLVLFLRYRRRSLASPLWAPLTLLAIHVALGVLYTVVVPAWEGFDEPGHFGYVRYLATWATLPAPGGDNLTTSEYHQPPLYYALEAVATSRVDITDNLTPRLNTFAWTPPGAKSLVVHGDGESWPYRGAVLAIHVGRLVSVAISTITVWLTYLLARTLFPARRQIALGAMAINAFIPSFLFIGAVVNNDNLVAMLSSLTLLITIQMLAGKTDWKTAIALGASLGMALLSKNNALVLLPVILIGLAMAAWQQRRPVCLVGAAVRLLVVLAVATVVAGWWYARNMLMFGTPIPGHLASGQLFISPPVAADFSGGLFAPAGVLYLLSFTWSTFWASFGRGGISAEPWLYHLIGLVTVAGAVGVVCFFAGREVRLAKMAAGLLLAHILLNGLMILYRTLPNLAHDDVGLLHGRFVIPTVSAISVLLAVGLAQLAGRRYAGRLLALVGGVVFAIALICPFRYIAPAYARPLVLTEDDLPPTVNRVDVRYGNVIRLLGTELDQESYRAGDTARLRLYWQALAPIKDNYTSFVHVVAPDGSLIGQRDLPPGGDSYPTGFWKAGEILTERYDVLIPAGEVRPRLLSVKAGLYTLSTMERLDASGAEGQQLGSEPTVAQARVRFAGGPQGSPVEATLEDAITLRSYAIQRMREDRLLPGESLALTLYWQAHERVPKDYVVFVHLADSAGRTWTQDDSPPAGGELPTSSWDTGEVVPDDHVLTIPADIPPGRYRLLAGMYSLETMARLDRVLPDGLREDGSVLLQVMTVGD